MSKLVVTIGSILVAIPVSIGVVFLFFFAIGWVHEFLNEDPDYETERLARDMAHDLRWLAAECVYSPLPWDEEMSPTCRESWDDIENVCKGTIAPALEEFCADWEVITYIRWREALMATSMIRLAQNIEEWLE